MAVAVGSATMMVRSLLQQQAEEELTTDREPQRVGATLRWLQPPLSKA